MVDAFSMPIFRRRMTHGKPDQGHYSGDWRRYQRAGKVAECGEQFHKEYPEPARDVNNFLKLVIRPIPSFKMLALYYASKGYRVRYTTMNDVVQEGEVPDFKHLEFEGLENRQEQTH